MCRSLLAWKARASFGWHTHTEVTQLDCLDRCATDEVFLLLVIMRLFSVCQLQNNWCHQVTGSSLADSLLRGRAVEASNICMESLKLDLEGLTQPGVPALALPAEKGGGGLGVG